MSYHTAAAASQNHTPSSHFFSTFFSPFFPLFFSSAAVWQLDSLLSNLLVQTAVQPHNISAGSWNRYIVCLFIHQWQYSSVVCCCKTISVHLCNYLYLLSLIHYNVMSIFNFFLKKWICWISVHFQKKKRLLLKWHRGTIKGFFIFIQTFWQNVVGQLTMQWLILNSNREIYNKCTLCPNVDLN